MKIPKTMEGFELWMYHRFSRRRPSLFSAAAAIVVAVFGIAIFIAGNHTGLVLAALGLIATVISFLVFHHETPQVFKARLAKLNEQSVEHRYVVKTSPEAVVVICPDGQECEIRLDQLESVRIVTTEQGPWLCDFWYLLTDGYVQCSVPLGATGGQALLHRLQALPGWDTELPIEALGSTINNEFLCWHRPAEEKEMTRKD